MARQSTVRCAQKKCGVKWHPKYMLVINIDRRQRHIVGKIATPNGKHPHIQIGSKEISQTKIQAIGIGNVNKFYAIL